MGFSSKSGTNSEQALPFHMFFLESLWLLPVLCQVLPRQLHASRLPDLDSPCVSFHSVCHWPPLSFIALPETRGKTKIKENLKGEKERERMLMLEIIELAAPVEGKTGKYPSFCGVRWKTGVHLSSYMKKHYRARDLPPFMPSPSLSSDPLLLLLMVEPLKHKKWPATSA